MTPHDLAIRQPLSFTLRRQVALGWLKMAYFVLAGFMFAGPLWLSLTPDSLPWRLARIELFGSAIMELLLMISVACFAVSMSQTDKPWLLRIYAWLHRLSRYFTAGCFVNLGRIAAWAYFSNFASESPTWWWRGPWLATAFTVASLTVLWLVQWLRRRGIRNVMQDARLGLFFSTIGLGFAMLLLYVASFSPWLPRATLITGIAGYVLACWKLHRPSRRLLHPFLFAGVAGGIVVSGLMEVYGRSKDVSLWLVALFVTVSLTGWMIYRKR